MALVKGIFVQGTLVKRDPVRNGYVDFYVSTSEIYAANRFSVKVGTPLETSISAKDIGAEVTLEVAAPYVGYGKTSGKPYQAGFFPLGVIE